MNFNQIKRVIVIGLTALHPILLIYLYPTIGEPANLLVFIAPVATTLLYHFWIGMAVVLINASVTAAFMHLAGMATGEGLPKAVLSIGVMSVLCFGAEKLRRYIEQRKILRQELDQAKRMEAIGRLAGGVAHDINNTLNAIMGSTFALRQELSGQEKRFKDIENIAAACDRGAQLTRNLLGFARKTEVPKQVFAINEVVQSTISLLERTITKNIRIETSTTNAPTFVEGDLSEFENAVMNLCLNSLDAMPDSGVLTLSTTSQHGLVTIKVTDTGIGMDSQTQEHVFEPFFSTKEAGKGTGLGLSLVYGVVQNMNGKLSLESSKNQGTTFSLSFPEAKTPPTNETPAKPTENQTETDLLKDHGILIVDDEPLVLRAGVRMLRALGAKVLSAPSGKEGVEIFKREIDHIQLVIIDLVMPEMDGIDTLDQILTIDQSMPALLISGYTREPHKMSKFAQKETIRFLSKPYEVAQLLEAVAPMLKDRPSDKTPIDHTGSA